MSTPLVVTMDALWPDMPEQRRPYEVVLTVAREDGGEPVVPRALPAVVLGCWSATQVVASVTVMAARPSMAVATAEALVPDLAQAVGVIVTVKAVPPGQLRRSGACGATGPAGAGPHPVGADGKVSGSDLRERHAPRPYARYLHRCHTRVPSLHPKPQDFKVTGSTTRSTRSMPRAWLFEDGACMLRGCCTPLQYCCASSSPSCQPWPWHDLINAELPRGSPPRTTAIIFDSVALLFTYPG
jgi:hypothetical protein